MYSQTGVYFSSQGYSYSPSYAGISGTSLNSPVHVIPIYQRLHNVLVYLLRIYWKFPNVLVQALCTSFRYNLHLLSVVVLLWDNLGFLVSKIWFFNSLL